MPFKSESQHRAFRAMLSRGEISQSTFDKWMDETRKKAKSKKHPIKGLPERVKKASLNEVAAIAVKKDGKLLMGKRRDNGKITNPGGHLEEGETPIEGAIRELEEETGIKAKASDLKFIKTVKVGDLKIHGYSLELKKDTSTSMRDDPDLEVERWIFMDMSKVKDKDLHVSRKDNVLSSEIKEVEKTASFFFKIGEEILGGLADHKPDSEFNPQQIRKGVKVEMEHTHDPKKAKEIAKDHLTEFDDYYDRLEKIEGSLKQAGLSFTKEEEEAFFRGFFKNAGGPGSGVSGNNTEIITELETSPVISIGYRKKFMEDHEPMFLGRDIPVNKIKYKCQEKCVPKKLNRMIESAEEDPSLFEKPAKFLLDDDGNYHVIDGHHRVLAAIRTGRDSLKGDVYVINRGEKKLAGLSRPFLRSFGKIFKHEYDNPNMLQLWGMDDFDPAGKKKDERLELTEENKVGHPESFQ